MGLDITFDAFHGAYSAFNQLRKFIAKAVGASFPPHEDKTLDNRFWYWDDDLLKPSSTLFILFNHSDCGGKINYSVCRKLAAELEALMPKFLELAQTEPVGQGHLFATGGYVEVIQRFIDGCKRAVEAKKPLEFY